MFMNIQRLYFTAALFVMMSVLFACVSKKQAQGEEKYYSCCVNVLNAGAEGQ